MIKINDPVVLTVSVIENYEPMVNLLKEGNFLLWSQVENVRRKVDFGNSKYPYVRKSVARSFRRVFSVLPKGWGIYLVEAYRNYEYQKKLFTLQVKKLKLKFPKKSMSELELEASGFVSNPDVYSPHVTGAAVDIAFVDENKNMIDVGNWFEYDDSAFLNFQELNALQLKNRSILKKVMLGAGFVNYPYEWWHWSYGDRYWGYVKGKDAIFGEIKFEG